MGKRTFALLTAAITAGVMVLALAPAYADHDDSVTSDSSISMTYKARRDRFIGAVESDRARCVGRRTVTVYKILRDGSRRMVDDTTTADDGSWSLTARRVSGRYGATVEPKQVTLDSGLDEYGDPWRHLLICRPASDTIRV